MLNNKTSFRSLLKEDSAVAELMPYERFLRYGPEALTDAELLAIIVRTGTADNTPVDIGMQLLSMSGKYEQGLSGLFHLTLDEIMSIQGVGKVKAVKIKCIAEISKRISRQKKNLSRDFLSPDSIAGHYMEIMRHYEKEHVMLLCFNHQLKFLCDDEISVGTVNNALLSPREVFISALKSRAVNIILLHNHPGGDPHPSDADINMTKQIRMAGELIEINLLDHIIIGDQNYFSFLEQKLIN